MFIPLLAQSGPKYGAIAGVVTDSSGALIPGGTVVLVEPAGTQRRVVSDEEGRYSFKQLPPGHYELRASAPGFSIAGPISIDVAAGRSSMQNLQLEIATVEQDVEVQAAAVDTEPTNNASALTLSGSALKSISDDPEDLAQDLQMLAGPSAGPEAGEIYVDGFSGAKLPPKSSIREIRVNQNPFSAEYDRIGYGRVEILTKPGADKYHGSAQFNFGDSALNSMNPFAPDKPDYQRRMLDATVGGPIGHKTSFTLQLERRDIGQAALINAMVLDGDLNPTSYRRSVLDPMANTEVSGRVDRQFGDRNTLVGRYEWEYTYQTNAGLNTFSMPTRAFDVDEREHVLQLTETAILSPRVVNEVRFQYRRSHDTYEALSSDPAVDVPEAFTNGGTSMDLNGLSEDRFELQNTLSFSTGNQILKFGGRFRAINELNASGNDYNGIYTFTSLDSYRTTEAGLLAGISPAEIRAQGGGASQFAMSIGDPSAAVAQFDLGVFIQNDWRVRKDLTLSGGLRFEQQTNLSNAASWGPRLGIAWGIPSGNPDKPFAVLRAGFGMFFDRIRENLVLDTRRLNGLKQRKYLIPNPDFYPLIPSADTLAQYEQNDTIRTFASNLRAPRTQQLAVSFEKQLPARSTVSISFMDSRGNNMLRSSNINAPIIETGTRPYSGGNIYEYQSNGRFRQQQLIANVNANISKRLNLFGYYTWNKARSDTDGAGTFPSSSYDLASEYSRAGYDARHRVMMGGSVTSWWGLLLNPFVVMHSGEPFNIYVGEDLNGDSIFNDRPAWATDTKRISIVKTAWGIFDSQPVPGQTIIPRNLGDSPGMASVNLRLSKAFGFGAHAGNSVVSSGGSAPSGMGPGRGHYHGADAVAEGSKYSVTLSASARNLLNHVNLGAPIGNLSSPVFGASNSIHGFGPGGASANRTIDLQVRFSF